MKLSSLLTKMDEVAAQIEGKGLANSATVLREARERLASVAKANAGVVDASAADIYGDEPAPAPVASTPAPEPAPPLTLTAAELQDAEGTYKVDGPGDITPGLGLSDSDEGDSVSPSPAPAEVPTIDILVEAMPSDIPSTFTSVWRRAVIATSETPGKGLTGRIAAARELYFRLVQAESVRSGKANP